MKTHSLYTGYEMQAESMEHAAEVSWDSPVSRELVKEADLTARRSKPCVRLACGGAPASFRSGVMRAAKEFRWEVLGEHTNPKRKLDGLLADALKCDSTLASDVPVVYFHSNAMVNHSAPEESIVVSVDPVQTGRTGAGHLLSLGMDHFVFFRSHRSEGAMKLADGFTAACLEAEKHSVLLDSSEVTTAERADWLLREVAKLPVPCAVMADDDRYAIEMIAAARECGLRVPEDIAVLGTGDNTKVHSRSAVEVSSVDMNLEMLGYTAAWLLDKRMRGEEVKPKKQGILPGRVICRKSTQTFACDIPGISKAILKIRSEYFQQISVPAMAKECGLSVRSLYRLYRATTGNTIGKDIMARRMEAAADMLCREDMKLEPIAMETGLGNAKNLCRLFKEYFGQTPGQWRASRREMLLQ